MAQSSHIRVVRLKVDSIMCQVGTCANEAEFLLKQGTNRIHAVCKKHLTAMGVSDADIPQEETE
jgi:hypothetical protein